MEPETFRTAKPIRHPLAETDHLEDGSMIIRIPTVAQRPWVKFFVQTNRLPEYKQFELEAVGAFVWDQCDGQQTNATIVRKLREEYNMNRLEAEASLSAFLETLSQRGLVSLLLRTKK
jgi:hypothetical protein